MTIAANAPGQMGNMEVEEVIERHVATLLMQDQAGKVAVHESSYEKDIIINHKHHKHS